MKCSSLLRKRNESKKIDMQVIIFYRSFWESMASIGDKIFFLAGLPWEPAVLSTIVPSFLPFRVSFKFVGQLILWACCLEIISFRVSWADWGDLEVGDEKHSEDRSSVGFMDEVNNLPKQFVISCYKEKVKIRHVPVGLRYMRLITYFW